MAKEKTPVTPAVRALRAAKVEFTDHVYAYEDHGGTALSARELGVDEHCVVKTIVMEDDRKKPLIVLMHGDLEVSGKQLARLAGCRSITACTLETANKHTGYLVGGTSPFGLRSAMPVYMEETILELARIFRLLLLVPVRLHHEVFVLADALQFPQCGIQIVAI